VAAKSRTKELEALVKRHQDLYYNGQPEISDAEFDALWDELEALSPDSPVLKSVGKDGLDGFPKAEHLIPMGSQAKAQDPEAFMKWAVKIGHPEYLVQYKLDGASLELQYEAGRFVRAVTRGDGLRGDDITPNASKMRGVLPAIDARFSGGVRGEVVMSHKVKAERFPDAANCRNAANGLMKRKDGEGAELLEVICYDASHAREASFFESERAKVEWLSTQGFAVVEQVALPTAEEVVRYRARVMAARADLPFDIDGLVVKGDAIDPEDMRRARPEKQIAFKFSLEEAISTLRSVEWSESGATYTPIGIIDPVQLMGTTVKRANLCNPDMLRAMDLRLGSRIVITKRGEIIPKIESLVENPAGASPIEVPSVCSCGTALVDSGTRLYCPNAECPKRAFHRIAKWLSVLDVLDFGEVILGRLFESGRVKGIPDLYTLTAEELSEYDRMGLTLARKIIKNLLSKESLPLALFIAGFDIEGIGELIAQKIISAGFDDLSKLRAATREELSVIKGIGEITADAFREGLAALSSEMDALLATGKVRIEKPSGEGRLSGLSFCFTGELSSMKRPKAEDLVRSMGAGVKSSVTKDLTYLVTNDPLSGSSKNQRAREFGVAVIDEKAFLDLIKEGQ
jgi:DNA ligase (NAD+)